MRRLISAENTYSPLKAATEQRDRFDRPMSEEKRVYSGFNQFLYVFLGFLLV
jgi:hypothetical protein